jgi:hypothetical protein
MVLRDKNIAIKPAGYQRIVMNILTKNDQVIGRFLMYFVDDFCSFQTPTGF